jgi:hypothetical protein
VDDHQTIYLTKLKKKKKKTWLKPVYLFSQIALCSKSGDQTQEDLAKSGYKINKVENLGILQVFGQPLETIS